MGNYSLAAFVVCAVIIGLIALCFAEVGSRFSDTGGPYLYARETLGPTLAQVFVAYLVTFGRQPNRGGPELQSSQGSWWFSPSST